MKNSILLNCSVSGKCYEVKKVYNKVSLMPISARYYATIYRGGIEDYIYHIYITDAGVFYAKKEYLKAN